MIEVAQGHALISQAIMLWAEKEEAGEKGQETSSRYAPGTDKGALHKFLQDWHMSSWTNYEAADAIGWDHPRTASVMNGLKNDYVVECVKVGARGIKVWKLAE